MTAFDLDGSHPMPPRAPKIAMAAGILLLLWIVSLFLRAASLGHGPDDVIPGFAVLIIGWFGFAMMQFGWWANPLLLVTLCWIVTARRPWRRTMIAFAVLLGLFAINALFWRDFPDDSGSNPILSFGPGYYLWLAAVFGTGGLAIAKANIESPAT